MEIDLFHALDKVEIHELFGMTTNREARCGTVHWMKSITPHVPRIRMPWKYYKSLEREGHEIYYITARPKEHGQRTMEWMIEQVSGSKRQIFLRNE